MSRIGEFTVFGYVRAMTPELKVKEHEYYKGTYCGLCHMMGKCTGQCSRMTLNYDFVLLALLRFALSGQKTSFSQKRCAIHPLKKRNVMNKNDDLSHCAYFSALLSYHKVLDDIADERLRKRLFTKIFLLPSARSMRRKVLKKSEYAALDDLCINLLGQLSEYEKSENLSPSVDMPANMFGNLLGEMLSFGYDDSKKRIAYSIGTHLGKWIYIADALDDLDDDRRLGRFNPFISLYGDAPLKQEELDGISDALKNELIGLEAALDLIDFGSDTTIKNIIYNIIYLGMPKKIADIIKKHKNEDSRKDNS